MHPITAGLAATGLLVGLDVLSRRREGVTAVLIDDRWRALGVFLIVAGWIALMDLLAPTGFPAFISGVFAIAWIPYLMWWLIRRE